MRPNATSPARRLLACVPLIGVAALLALSTGCARPNGVPPFTHLVAEAPGQAAAFQAPDDGTIWVGGPGRPGQPRHIVFSGLVHRGEVVSVDPAARQLIVDGKPAEATIEGGSSYYQIWYQPVYRSPLLN